MVLSFFFSFIIPSQPSSYACKDWQLSYQPHYNMAHDGPAQAVTVLPERLIHETLALREANLSVGHRSGDPSSLAWYCPFAFVVAIVSF